MATVVYPYDDSGRAATNLVKNELQVLTVGNNDPFRYFVPSFAPFYENNFKLEGKDALGNYKVLTLNVDYNFTVTYIGATRANGAALWGAVNIINQTIQGPVRLQYQTLGGKYASDRDFVVRTIAENNYNPRIIAWDQVTSIQEYFPPSKHPQDLDTFTGYRDMIDAVNGLASAPSEAQTLHDLLWRHILDHNDPHETLRLIEGYVTQAEMNASIAVVDSRIDAVNATVAVHSNDIANLKNGIIDSDSDFQIQIDNNKAAIAAANVRINSVNGRVDQLTDVVAANDAKQSGDVVALTARVVTAEANVVDNTNAVNTVSNSLVQLDSKVNSNYSILVDKNNAQDATVNLVTETNTRLETSVVGLAGRVAIIEQTIQLLPTVPVEKAAELIIVTTPHRRFMVWDAGTNAYIRAPWHLPGMLSYSYTNPSYMEGYLPVRGDVVYQQADYPDLAKALTLSGTGTFALVEMRGEFLRVLDNGRGVDVSRQLRSFQASAIGSHNHYLPTSDGSADDIVDGPWTLLNAGSVPVGAGGPLPTSNDGGASSPWVRANVNVSPESGKPEVTTYPNPLFDSTADPYDPLMVGNVGQFAEETYPRNIAVPLWISY